MFYLISIQVHVQVHVLIRCKRMEFMSIDLKPSECILLYLGCSLFFSDGVDRLPHLFIFFLQIREALL